MESRANGGNWTNSSFVVSTADPTTLEVTAVEGADEIRYLYADWPVATVFNADGFPATPFTLPVTTRRAELAQA